MKIWITLNADETFKTHSYTEFECINNLRQGDSFIEIDTFNSLKLKVKSETTLFDSLVFEARSKEMGGVQAKHFFPNGYGVSVVGGGYGLYGDGEDTFEVAVIKGENDKWELCYTTPITEDVLGYQSKEEVAEIMKQVSEL